jgi:hypothetical protein
MFGFVKSNGKSHLGGEIFRQQKRKRTIVTLLLALLGFIIFNIILYLLTTM